MAPGAGRIGVLQDVAGPVDAGRLAVPDAEHAVDRGAGMQVHLLAAPDRRRREIFVNTGLKGDFMLLKERLGAGKLLIVAAKRRAAISGDETTRVQAVPAVAPRLVQRQADKGMDAAHQADAVFRGIFIFERNPQSGHSLLPAKARSGKVESGFPSDRATSQRF